MTENNYETLQWQLDEGRITTDEFMDRIQKIKQTPSKKTNKKNRTGNKYLVSVLTKGDIMSETYRKVFNDKTTLYLFLKANIVRGHMLYDLAKIFDRYYDKGFLACSFTERSISKQCNITRYKVRKYIQDLSSKGIIRVEKVWINKNNSPLVFILGTYQYIEGKLKERFYLEDIMDRGE